MAYLPWNAGFESSPVNTDPVGEGDDRIREVKEQVRDRLETELLVGSGGADNGRLQAGAARVFVATTAPTQIATPDAGTSPSQALDDGRVWVNTNARNAAMVRSGGAWVPGEASNGVSVWGSVSGYDALYFGTAAALVNRYYDILGTGNPDLGTYAPSAGLAVTTPADITTTPYEIVVRGQLVSMGGSAVGNIGLTIEENGTPKTWGSYYGATPYSVVICPFLFRQAALVASTTYTYRVLGATLAAGVAFSRGVDLGTLYAGSVAMLTAGGGAYASVVNGMLLSYVSVTLRRIGA